MEKSTQEIYFGFDELFFSRTDRKGLILSGNTVFKRISEYEWNELLNKPHNKIRHPDMPKGVFHLFWDHLLNKKPVGAYVKNKSKTGKYYWVYALAFPFEDNFISIRLKPSSEMFNAARSAYENLLKTELVSKLSPENSHKELLKILSGLGFENYFKFMLKALLAELESRQGTLGNPPIEMIENLVSLQKNSEILTTQFQKVTKEYNLNSLVPLNLEIKTNIIGELAAPLSVVALKYDEMALEINSQILSFPDLILNIQNGIEDIQFAIVSIVLLSEVITFFANEPPSGDIDIIGEMKKLKKLSVQCIEGCKEKLANIDNIYNKIVKNVDDLNRISAALEIVRLTGRIEAFKITDTTNSLLELINQLSVFRNTLTSSLDEVQKAGKHSQIAISKIWRSVYKNERELIG